MPRPNMAGKAVTAYLPTDVKDSLSGFAKIDSISMSHLLEFAWRWYGAEVMRRIEAGERPEPHERGPQPA